MNLDELLCQHRAALRSMAVAQSDRDRQTYADLASYYSERIGQLRRATGENVEATHAP